jgi:hypothetical protein
MINFKVDRLLLQILNALIYNSVIYKHSYLLEMPENYEYINPRSGGRLPTQIFSW